ncbi:DUF1876 domain-containing protein [Streptomyces sp. NPDC088354]|uniref:DUF1876 domain-containing protein n=1 Tax=unclassified Streptomyces TaxID=2593676 RepID=UPI0029AC0E06|nr:DUF1876 domain-containing protein [Streptomyces sp. MI02-7b]MDX3073348.1 DUF1876 domain-containing protein [Streptomyces sp. MI02-7b]
MQTLVGWHIEMDFREEGSRTKAAALLRLPDGTEVRSHGHANRHPADPSQDRVGEELAAARALNDLARQLLGKAAHEIEEVTHISAHPRI